MNDGATQQQGTLVSVKRVRKGLDAKERQRVVLTFGTDKDGNNGLDALISALETYRGKQVNFDIRLDTKETQHGASFDTAFVIIKEMIPKDQQAGGSTYVHKNKARTNEVRDKVKAKKITEDFG